MYARILVALDGSQCCRHGGRLALSLAAAGATEVLACHVYSAQLHNRRFGDMEPGLPPRYRQGETLAALRSAHDGLIREGFGALSQGYLEPLLHQARAAGVPARALTTEGRSYAGILRLAQQEKADLIVLGACGLGSTGDGLLGSTAMQVLRHAACDVLIARRDEAPGAVLAGTDGSDDALVALRRAAGWAAALRRPLHLTAAYDVQFHTAVFRAMGASLSAQRQQQVGLAQQEQLHDELINDGLGKLYRGFLDQARAAVATSGLEVAAALLTGKAYRALLDYAAVQDAALVVLGRFGAHREPVSLLGATAEATVRLARTNVLVTAGSSLPPEGRQRQAQSNRTLRDAQAAPPCPRSLARAGQEQAFASGCGELPWDAPAQARLARVPQFARPMARRAVEQAVRDGGGQRVTLEAFLAVARQFGMAAPEGPGHG